MSVKKSNVFTDTAGVIACEGLHTATVIATHHVGERDTMYGKKDWQMFHLRVTQFNESGEQEVAEIHQQYHRSLNPQSSLVRFLTAFGIKAHRGMRIDFDELVGKKLSIVVEHTVRANGVHANIRPLPPKGSAQ